MGRYRLTISYRGTAYAGWQWQENAPSVQRAVEEAQRTVAVAVLISLFVSFTLTPMLSARFIKVSHKENFFFRILGGGLLVVSLVGLYRMLAG